MILGRITSFTKIALFPTGEGRHAARFPGGTTEAVYARQDGVAAHCARSPNGRRTPPSPRASSPQRRVAPRRAFRLRDGRNHRRSPMGREVRRQLWCPPPLWGACAVRCHFILAGGDDPGRPPGESRGVAALSGGKKGDLSKTGGSSKNHLRSENRLPTSSVPSSFI